MFVLDDLLVGGLRFVLEKVAAAADAQLNDPARWREALVEAQMQLEQGKISEAEFAARERDILAELRRCTPDAFGLVASADDVSAVDVQVVGEDDED